MKRILVPLVVMLGAFALYNAPAYAEDPLLPDEGVCAHEDSGSVAQQESAARCLIDAVRDHDGEDSVTWLPLLNKAADWKARRIESCDDFSHTPCGDDADDAFVKSGYISNRYRVLWGESLAYGSTPRQAVDDWLGDPPHRRILLSKGWQSAGIALVNAADFQDMGETALWVLDAGSRVARR